MIKRYTKAILGAFSENELEEMLRIFKSLSLCFDNEKFNSIINSPTISKKKKEEFIINLAESKNKKIINLLKILVGKNRLNLIPEICDNLNNVIKSKNNEYELVVSSSFNLTKKDIETLQNKLGSKLGLKLYATQKQLESEGIKLFVGGVSMECGLLKNSFENNLKNHILKSF